MKERLITVLKWFFITLGILYLIQVVFVSGAVLGIMGLARVDISRFEKSLQKNSLKPIITSIEEYKNKNGKYPQSLDGIKLNKKSTYNYSLSDDGTCYTLIETTKDNRIKEFKCCSSNSENTSINSQSYTEYNK